VYYVSVYMHNKKAMDPGVKLGTNEKLGKSRYKSRVYDTKTHG